MKAFAAVVERASFARAAKLLGVSPSALSQTIRQLKTRLGVRLLNRTMRSVGPTAPGSRLYEGTTPLILELDAAVMDAVASTGRISGTFRINTPGMAARRLISPQLGRFHRMHPQIVFDIVVDDSLTDIVAGRFDAGIRVGNRLEKDMTVIRLTPDVRLIVAASADYLALRGEPASPVDLRRHACINGRLPGRDGVSRWDFERKGKKIEIAVNGSLISNRQDVAVEAALQGLGTIYCYDDEGVGEAIAHGKLKLILTEWSPRDPAYISTTRIVAIPILCFARSSTVCLIGTRPSPSDGGERSVKSSNAHQGRRSKHGPSRNVGAASERARARREQSSEPARL